MTKQKTAVTMLAAVTLPALVLTFGCGDRQTVASKSAEAYDEAQRKGVPVGEGHGHGQSPAGGASPSPGGPHAGHGTPAAEPQQGDAHGGHGGMATKDHGTGATPHAPMSHEQIGHSRTAGAPAGHEGHAGGAAGRRAGVDHSKMGHSEAAGVDHSKMGQSGTAGVDHSKMGPSQMAGMDHLRMAQHGGGMALPPPKPEPPSATAAPGEPAATLRPDPLDAPAPTAVTSAARAAAMAAEMASGGHGMQHGTYVQIDAGRDDVTPTQAPGSGHGAHQAVPQPRPTPAADPHRMHGSPAAPRPAPSPAGGGRPPFSPPSVHQGHGTAAPQAKPSPSPDPQAPSPAPSPSPRTEEEHR